jgi:tetratricopeptide (TPR) repeat protein
MVKTRSTQAQVGKRLRKLRLERGLSQEDLAGSRYSAAYISHIEHGKRRASEDALRFFAEQLGTSMEELLTGRSPDADLLLELEIERSFAAIHGGDAAGSLERLESARVEARAVGASRALARAEEAIALALFKQGLYKEALITYEGLDTSLDQASAEERTPGVVGMARCLFHLGRLHDALDIVEPHLARLNRSSAPDPTALMQVYACLIPVYYDLGQVERAKDAAAKGTDLVPEVADPAGLACLHVNRAGLLLEEKQTRGALAALARAQDLYRQLGWRSEATKVALARGVVFSERNDLARAAAEFRLVLDDRSVSPRDLARAHTGLSLIARRVGNPAEGLDHAREALDALGDGVPGEAAEANREAGMCVADLGREDEALSYWRRSLEFYLEVGDNGEAAKTARLIGEALEGRGDLEGAARIYREGLGNLEQVR